MLAAKTIDIDQALALVESAFQANQLTAGAVENIKIWLCESPYQEYVPELMDHIVNEQWEKLDDVFWTIIPFGTGGRRGKMYPFGSNAINTRTIGESAQGLANYVKSQAAGRNELKCAIAYDTRHRSVEFSRLCAEIMVAAGFKVFYLDDVRATPELSFMIRHQDCDCGIMVTASHNPPSDNAVKCYWSTGGQILPPHDQGVIDRVMDVKDIERVDFDEAVQQGKIEICTQEIDKAFIDTISQSGFEGSRDLKILYSPLHGVGATAVCPVLEKDGFQSVEVFGPHSEPSGDFPNVPGNVSNPENSAVFDEMIEYAQDQGHQLIMASDPDCDRLGAAAPLTSDTNGPWATLNGNEIGALLTDFVLRKRKKAGRLSSENYVVKTLVTTDLIRKIADEYQVRLVGDLLVGFKWIGGAMDDHGPDQFVLGTEESHGYLVGQYARDKDGAVAAMLLSELAAEAWADGKTLHQVLDGIHRRHGVHREHLMTQQMPGSEGMNKMSTLMAEMREDPPESIGGLKVVRSKDFQHGIIRHADMTSEGFEGPVGNLVFLELEQEGNYIAVRPSGTEPKVKFYIFTSELPNANLDLSQTRRLLEERVNRIRADLADYAKSF